MGISQDRSYSKDTLLEIPHKRHRIINNLSFRHPYYKTSNFDVFLHQFKLHAKSNLLCYPVKLST